MSFTVGILLAFGGIQVAMNAEDPRLAAAELAIPAAFVAALVLAVPPLALREPARAGLSGGRGLLPALRDVLATSAARRLLGVEFIESAGVGAVGTMAPYIAEYLLRRPEVVGLLPAAYVISGVVAIPIWVRLSRSFGKRETWMAAMLIAAAAFAGIWRVGPGDLPLLLMLLVVAGAAMGCGGVLGKALLADVIDLDERRTGERKEGIYSAASTLALKVGAALAIAASGPVMTAAASRRTSSRARRACAGSGSCSPACRAPASWSAPGCSAASRSPARMPPSAERMAEAPVRRALDLGSALPTSDRAPRVSPAKMRSSSSCVTTKGGDIATRSRMPRTITPSSRAR